MAHRLNCVSYKLSDLSILSVTKKEKKPPKFPDIVDWPMYLGVFTHRWQLTNFDLDSCEGEMVSEPISRHHDTSTVFKMILVRGSDGASKFMNIRLALVKSTSLPMFATVTYTVSNNLNETDSFTFTHYFTKPLETALQGDHNVFPGMPWGYPKDGGLDIYCTITANLCRPTSVGRRDGTCRGYSYFQEVPHYRRFKADQKYKDGIICSRHSIGEGSSIEVEYPVHRGLAVSASDLCRTLFSELRNTCDQKIHVPDISRVIMEAVLQYMYVGWTTNFQSRHANKMEDLLKAANDLQMNDLKALCEYELLDSLNMRSCTHLLKFAVANNCKIWLKPRVIQFMRLCKDRIVNSKNFGDLCEEDLNLAKEVYPEHFELTPSEIDPAIRAEIELKFVQYVIPQIIDT